MKDTNLIPDPKMHLYISLVKSGLRLAAACSLMFGETFVAGGLFFAAELLGIAEEIV